MHLNKQPCVFGDSKEEPEKDTEGEDFITPSRHSQCHSTSAQEGLNPSLHLSRSLLTPPSIPLFPY